MGRLNTFQNQDVHLEEVETSPDQVQESERIRSRQGTGLDVGQHPQKIIGGRHTAIS
jgi:hypothetical protein